MSTAIALSYDEDTKTAVSVAVTGLPTPTIGEVTGIVQRSSDGGVRYTTVRGHG